MFRITNCLCFPSHNGYQAKGLPARANGRGWGSPFGPKRPGIGESAAGGDCKRMDCETGWIGCSRRCRRTADVHESQAAFWEETKRKRRADQIDGVMGGRIEDWLLVCISNFQGWAGRQTIGIEELEAKGPKRTQSDASTPRAH